ncbi:MAG: hypothetical protein SCH71_06585 [Desulfobulbaceae bacterium]|nr:hypothetical protein [Desulfobulbaceae bacterium]
MYNYQPGPGAGIFTLLIFVAIIFGLVSTVMMFLLPFFVYRIRNEIIELNKKNNKIISLLSINNQPVENKNNPPEVKSQTNQDKTQTTQGTQYDLESKPLKYRK